jgi:hypothetical protein
MTGMRAWLRLTRARSVRMKSLLTIEATGSSDLGTPDTTLPGDSD